MIKVERSFPAPLSLAEEAEKANGSYHLPDVVARLREDFYDKCYICGIKPVTDPEVEHRLPHKNNTIPGRKFAWENLFWCCRHCNSVKNQPKYDTGILDCRIDDPERLLEVSVDERGVSANAVGIKNGEASLTAELICETFNLKNTGIRVAASEARLQLLLAEMNKLFGILEKYGSNLASFLVKKKLRILLKRESAFAEFKRGYVRKNLASYPELQIFLD